MLCAAVLLAGVLMPSGVKAESKAIPQIKLSIGKRAEHADLSGRTVSEVRTAYIKSGHSTSRERNDNPCPGKCRGLAF